MRGIRLARRYSAALCSLAFDKQMLDQVEAEFRFVLEVLEEPKVRAIFQSRRIAGSRKIELVENLFKGRISGLVLNFLKVVIQQGRESYLEDMYKSYVEYANRTRGSLDVIVRSARDLSSDVAAELQRKLIEATGKKVRVSQEVDPSLIGGMMIQIGDTVIDGSIKARLRMLKAALQGENSN